MNFNDAKNYLKEIMKIDSVESESEPGKPFGKGVYECLTTSLAILEKEGFAVKNGNGYYGYGEIGSGELFGILCHLDVVPVGKGWTYPPFGAVEENNKIYARGALDDKSPFIGCLYALKRLLDEGYRPSKRIRIILGCDEESGWKCMDEYVKKETLPALGISPDGDFPVINCEKGIVYHSIGYRKSDFFSYIRSGERANMVPDYAEAKVRALPPLIALLQEKNAEYTSDGDFVIIKTKGVSSHGSRPEKGENALIKLLSYLAPFDDMAKEVYFSFRSTDGKGIGLALSDEKSGFLTLNLGTAKTVGDEIVFELDVRHPVSYRKEEVTKALEKHLSGKVQETFFHLPLYVDKEHFLVKSLLDAYNKVTGENAVPISIGGGTYARVLPLGVAFGPCFPNSEAGIHCADEYVDLDEFKRSTEIYYEAFKTICFAPKN